MQDYEIQKYVFDDSRNIKSGQKIPVENYSDQPYIVKTDDGAWLLVLTTGAGAEGRSGQHVVSMRSLDKGKTWQEITNVESAQNPESSYAVLYKTDFGRVYCFYNYNADDIRNVRADSPPYKDGLCTRVDTQGYFVFKYSDDNGISWCEKWREIPARLFAVDKNNPYKGKIKFFWNTGKPFEIGGAVYVPIYKIGRFGEGFMRDSEGALLFCGNINTEKDPDRLVWSTLPDGDYGIKADYSAGDISEEHSFVTLSDNSIFCVFRTVSGSSYCCYSRDKGHTFTPPEPMRFPDGRVMKHPRAANFIWKCQNGKYIYWYHNHGGTWYEDRNPAWLSGAVEYRANDGMRLKFSQPEPILYDEDALIRMSYPDLVEDAGEYYITETQKNQAYVHHVNKELIEGLWKQFKKSEPPKDGIILNQGGEMPKIAPFIEHDHSFVDGRSKRNHTSFAFDFDIIPGGESVELFSTLNSAGAGLCAFWDTKSKEISFQMHDSRRSVFWSCDPIIDSGRTHITVIIDGSACLIEFIINGNLCDGGTARQFGFGRFDQSLFSAAGSKQIKIDNSVRNLCFYNRLLTVSEAVVIFEESR